MKCDICKDDFPDDELVEADIMTCDDDGNICEGPKSHVCYMCRTLIVAVGIGNQNRIIKKNSGIRGNRKI